MRANRGLISDDEGRAYVYTYKRSPDGEGFYYNIFNAGDKYILKVPFKAHPHVIKWNKLYTIEDVEEAYQYIKKL